MANVIEVARQLRKAGRDPDEIDKLWRDVALNAGTTEVDWEMLIAVLRDFAPEEVPPLRDLKTMLQSEGAEVTVTQDSIAEELSERLRNKVCWVQKRNAWMIANDNGIWSEEEREGVQSYAQEAVVSVRPDAPFSWVRGVKDYLKAKLPERNTVWDKYPYLMGVANGVVDLERQELLAPDPSLRLTRCAPVPWLAFEGGASTETWERHLLNLFDGDSEKVDWFQLAIGSSLVGAASEKDQVIITLLGPPGTGKGSAVRALLKALGHDSNGLGVSMRSTDLTSGASRHLQWLTRLNGARLGCLEELPARKLDVQMLKTLSGADPITANKMRENDETWEPTHTLMLIANNIPKFDTDPEGMRRRLQPLRTRGAMSEREMDTGHDAVLAGEAPGILAWAIEGCRLWQEIGGKLPLLDSMREARDEIMDANDQWAEWGEACVSFTQSDKDVLFNSEIVNNVNWFRAGKGLRNLQEHEHSFVFEWLRGKGASQQKSGKVSKNGTQNRGLMRLQLVSGPGSLKV